MSHPESTKTPLNDGKDEEIKSPFPFLESVVLDIIQVIHAVILSSLSAQNKNEIVSKILKDQTVAYSRYIDWRRQITKLPPPLCLDPLPDKLRSEVIVKLSYKDFDGVHKICEDYPYETKGLSEWMNLVLDRSNYLILVYDEAKATLEKFLKGSRKIPVPKKRTGVESVGTSKEDKEPLKVVPAESPEKSLEKPLPEVAINFLLLGESGVGKTTFINSMINYLRNNFDEIVSKKTQPVVLVDTAFNIFSGVEKMNKVIVKADKEYRMVNSNEILIDGQSSTQDPITYKYVWIDDGQQKIIRIIDTPGVNDTRGVEQDSKNFDVITRHITKIGSIHAVCVIMKPNEMRLSPAMKFCLNTLLLRCYHSATRNILFCFTNCRSSMWKPAESLATLRRWMDEVRDNKGINIVADKSNVFCFDNDCLRYILTIKVCPDFRKATEDEIYSKGWQKNTEEIKRFLKRVTSAPTVDFNEFDQIKDLFSTISPTLVKILDKFERRRKEIEDELQKMKKNVGAKANKIVSNKINELQLFENEGKAIVQVCSEFATYFSLYSVFPIINYFEEGLKQLIQEEKTKSGDSLTYYALLALQYEYNECIVQAKEQIQASRRAVKDANELIEMVENLTRLALCGEHILKSKEVFYENLHK